MVRIHRLLLLLCFAAAAARVAPAQPPADADSVNDVLARAGAYVRDFQVRLAGIVAEERYVQQVKYLTPATAIGAVRANPPPDARRVLKSDLLLVKPEGATRWVQFRDVFEVDGKPVHDRSERLVKLFLEPTASSAQQVTQIVNESARFNIGSVQRTINVPVLALIILDPANQRRFSFERSNGHKPQLGSEPKVAAGADVWVIEYDEVSAGTLIRTNNDRDLPIHGRIWIEPSSGRVFATELSADDTSLKGTIDVTYRIEPTLNLLVPADMRERYELRKDGSRVEGTATYTQFRQFQVKVDEKLAPIK